MKNVFKWDILIVLHRATVWVANLSYNIVQSAKLKKESLSVLPDLFLYNSDSLLLTLSERLETSIGLIYFNSSCEHYQYEATAIRKIIIDFNESSLNFMSTELLSAINEFAATYKLNNYTNVHLTKINGAHLAEVFGNLALPHIYIHGSDKKLRKEFNYEIKVEAIIL